MSHARQADYPIDDRFLARWSPRAFHDAPISRAELLGLLEAARWSPSAANSQPWRFIYVLRGSKGWDRAVDLLNAGNQVWARNAAALIFIAARTVIDGKDGPRPARNHAFDAGSSWAHFALQADHAGWRTHAMGGFDAERAQTVLKAPADTRVLVAVALGRQGAPELLPEALQARENPTARLPLSALAFEDAFPNE